MAIRTPLARGNGSEEIDLRDPPARAHDRAGSADSAEAPAVQLEELWQHRAALRDLSRRIVGDAATAEDVVQDTYLRALRNLHRIERRPSLIPWLTTVAKRRSIDMIRDRQRVAPVEEMPDTPARSEFDPLVRALAGDTVDRVREALATLNDRERRLLSLQVDGGLSLEELADDDGASVDSVRSVLARARSKLKTALVDSGVAAALPFGSLGSLLRRMRDRVQRLGVRTQQSSPALAASLDRFADMVAAGAVALAIGAGPAATPIALVDQPAVGALPSPAAALASPQRPSSPARPLPDLAATSGADAPGPGDAPGVGPIGAAVPTGILPGAADEADGPEDVGADSVAVARGEGSNPVIVLAGNRLRGCTTDCVVVLRSDDGGRTWDRLAASGITGTTVVPAPGFPDDPRIVASGRQGISISHDGGTTFTRIAGPAVGAPIALSPAFSSGDARVLIGTAPAWVYDDSSRTAVPLATAPAISAPAHFAFDPTYATSGRLFMAGTGGVTADGTGAALYRCTARAGNDVCEDQSALPGLTAVSGLRVAGDPGAGGEPAVIVWGGASMLLSRDGGATFVPATLPAGSWISGIAEAGDGTLFGSATAAPGAPSAASGGLLSSVDGGATWAPISVPVALARGTGAVAVLPSGRVIAAPLASEGGGLWCSDDSGATWGSCQP